MRLKSRMRRRRAAVAMLGLQVQCATCECGGGKSAVSLVAAQVPACEDAEGWLSLRGKALVKGLPGARKSAHEFFLQLAGCLRRWCVPDVRVVRLAVTL